MSKNKELVEYITDQLSDLVDIRNIPMMGGYIFYYKERIFGGIYGNGFMVKITEASKKWMPGSEPEPPYKGAKPMLPVTILVFLCGNSGYISSSIFCNASLFALWKLRPRTLPA